MIRRLRDEVQEEGEEIKLKNFSAV